MVFKTQEHFPSSQPSKLPRPANLGGWLPKLLHAGILCRKAHGRVKNSADQSELPICFGELGKRRCQADSQLDITGFRGLHLLVWHEGCHHDRCEATYASAIIDRRWKMQWCALDIYKRHMHDPTGQENSIWSGWVIIIIRKAFGSPCFQVSWGNMPSQTKTKVGGVPWTHCPLALTRKQATLFLAMGAPLVMLLG